MPTNYPGSLDSLTNPASSDATTSPDHAAQHTNANDAIEALEAKAGVNASGVVSSLDYKVEGLVGTDAVLEFGIPINGTSDCTASIQAALDAAASTKGVVYLRPYRYKCNTGLTIPAGVALKMDGYSEDLGVTGPCIFAGASMTTLIDMPNLGGRLLDIDVDGADLANNTVSVAGSETLLQRVGIKRGTAYTLYSNNANRSRLTDFTVWGNGTISSRFGGADWIVSDGRLKGGNTMNVEWGVSGGQMANVHATMQGGGTGGPNLHVTAGTASMFSNLYIDSVAGDNALLKLTIGSIYISNSVFFLQPSHTITQAVDNASGGGTITCMGCFLRGGAGSTCNFFAKTKSLDRYMGNNGGHTSFWTGTAPAVDMGNEKGGAEPFSVGASMEGSPPSNGFRMVWRAPFACTVTNVRSHFNAGTNVVANARKNQSLDFLASDYTNSTANVWGNAGAVQNASVAAGDDIEIELVSTSGAVTQANIQVDLTRP